MPSGFSCGASWFDLLDLLDLPLRLAETTGLVTGILGAAIFGATGLAECLTAFCLFAGFVALANLGAVLADLFAALLTIVRDAATALAAGDFLTGRLLGADFFNAVLATVTPRSFRACAR